MHGKLLNSADNITYAALCNKSSEYLINQRAITAENQNSLTPIVDEGKAGYIGNIWRKTEIIKEFRILIKALKKLEYWKLVDINQFCPVSRKIRFYIDENNM
ncbi:unnamed protein product [Rhizophagus irregularis]|nr:unnamed protein product [Rhizophagus irregularis]